MTAVRSSSSFLRMLTLLSGRDGRNLGFQEQMSAGSFYIDMGQTLQWFGKTSSL